MGGGTYSCSSREIRLKSTYGDAAYYTHAPVDDIFKQNKKRTINSSMNPSGVKIRESRDSKEHPESLAIILALDVTGSMGSIPHHLVKEGLPSFMAQVVEAGVDNPQVLFLGIGDHECDSFPLQVGQFESSDELMDKWLTDLYLEGGGGGNIGESYLLSWYFAAYHTSIDCFEKRKQKGFLFTIGDEPPLRNIPKESLEDIMGKGQFKDMSATELLGKVKESYNVFHILVKQGSAGSDPRTFDGWKQLMGKNLIIAENYRDIPKLIAEKVVSLSQSVGTKLGGNKPNLGTKITL